MKKLVEIKVPNNNSQDEWFSMVNHYLKLEGNCDHVLVDFNQVKFLEVDDLVVLACLLEVFCSRGSTISFTGGTKKLNSHLENIKFKKYWDQSFDRSVYTTSLNRTTLCLWRVNPSMIYDYSHYAKTYFGSFVKKKDLVALASNMDEVFNNIIDHAKTETQGYIITQYYPASNHLSFSVCDLGVGIPNSVNAYLQQMQDAPIDDWQALLRAIEMGFSVKSTPKNRGLGLNNAMDLIESSRGTILIRSNMGYLFKSAGGMYRVGNMKTFFPGTLIKVRVDLNAFDDRDDHDSIMEF
jgi:hypothetical protein